MRLIHTGQKLHIRRRIAPGETVATINRHRHLARLPITLNQPRPLGPAQSRHLLQVAPQQASRLPALLQVLVVHQHLLHPPVNLLLCLPLEPDPFAGFQKLPDLIQTQLLGFMHADRQSSVCHPLQAHLALESHLPFRLILYWIRLCLPAA